MVTYHNGDLLKSSCDIICHQVNLQGVMGGGIARQIATAYPEVEKDYINFCEQNNYDCLGMVCISSINNTNKFIANIFSQNEDFTTNYKCLHNCINLVKEFAMPQGKDDIVTIGIPFKYGAGIANGNWETIETIFKDVFENEVKIELQIWKL